MSYEASYFLHYLSYQMGKEADLCYKNMES